MNYLVVSFLLCVVGSWFYPCLTLWFELVLGWQPYPFVFPLICIDLADFSDFPPNFSFSFFDFRDPSFPREVQILPTQTILPQFFSFPSSILEIQVSREKCRFFLPGLSDSNHPGMPLFVRSGSLDVHLRRLSLGWFPVQASTWVLSWVLLHWLGPTTSTTMTCISSFWHLHRKQGRYNRHPWGVTWGIRSVIAYLQLPFTLVALPPFLNTFAPIEINYLRIAWPHELVHRSDNLRILSCAIVTPCICCNSCLT